jgi:tRNA nucleotidyltransferase (CCA-adding enzyme)
MIKKLNYLLVGGAVRDHLLGIASKDRDYVVVGSSPEEMLANGFTQVGASFPVFLHPETGEEYALARTERKTGAGYHGFSTVYDSSVTLEDDLARRDLTINSMAMTDNLQVIDPFNGIADLEAGILRHTSEAFADDPLRVLRLARFAARYNFKIADETMALSRKLVDSGELDALPRERIWTEMYKGFSEKMPSLMLNVLQDAHAMKVTPLVEYFGMDFDVDAARNLMSAATMVKTNVNRVDANAVFAMPMLSTATPEMK